MRRDLFLRSELCFPPVHVWHALTDAAALSSWLLPAQSFVPTVGRSFQFRAESCPGRSGLIEGVIYELRPLSSLAYSWRTGWSQRSTSVRWTIAAAPGAGQGTELSLDHLGFEGLHGLAAASISLRRWRLAMKRLPLHLAAGAGSPR